jgi:hypothetical protein
MDGVGCQQEWRATIPRPGPCREFGARWVPNVRAYTGTMPDAIRVRLRWRDGRLDTWPDAVDATAAVVQILGPDGRYHGFVDSGEIDEEGFVILDEEPTGE